MTHSADVEDQARRSFYRLAGRFATALTIETELGLLTIPTNDEVIGERTFVEGSFESRTTELALRVLREHGAVGDDLADRDVLEVGANIGTQTLTFARTLRAHRVIALEPAPATVALLRATVAANALESRVMILPIAASAQEGRVRMEANPSNIGDWRVQMGSAAGEMGEATWPTVEVRACPLDHLAEDGTIDVDRLGLVWMDCQGHEGHILAGAARLLRSEVPIVSEFWPYGLRRAGGLERFAELVAASGRQVIDLRAAHDGVPVAVDGSELLALAESYGPPHFASVDVGFTDLLLLATGRPASP